MGRLWLYGLLMTAALVLAVASLVVAPVHLECPDVHTFAADAQQYTGSSDHSAIFVFTSRRLILRIDICDILDRLANGDQPPEDARGFPGFAVFVLSHELAHASGVADETTADCEAARSFLSVAAALAIPPPLARSMAIASAPYDGYVPSAIAGCWPAIGQAVGTRWMHA